MNNEQFDDRLIDIEDDDMQHSDVESQRTSNEGHVGSYNSPPDEDLHDDLHEDTDVDRDTDKVIDVSHFENTFAPDSQMLVTNNSTVVDDTDYQSWLQKPREAINETEKEYLIFKSWLESGTGRSKTYISKVYNLPESTIYKIATKNNWDLRASDYDRHQLQIMAAAENTRRAVEHRRKLEEYRQQQEFIGRSLSSDAAKLAAIVGNTLDRFMSSDREIDIRDLPAVLNAANKAAEVGRNLQSSSLGVDQLLTALEEVDE